MAAENERQPLISLPEDLLSDVILRVVDDTTTPSLLPIKLCCTGLKNVCESSNIHQNVSLLGFPYAPWWPRQTYGHELFFSKCLTAKNLEALYRQGVMDYFCHNNMEAAMEYLEEAAKNGHKNASYILALIYLCKDDDYQNQKGITILLDLNKDSTAWDQKLYRYQRSLDIFMNKIRWQQKNATLDMRMEEIYAVQQNVGELLGL